MIPAKDWAYDIIAGAGVSVTWVDVDMDSLTRSIALIQEDATDVLNRRIAILRAQLDGARQRIAELEEELLTLKKEGAR